MTIFVLWSLPLAILGTGLLAAAFLVASRRRLHLLASLACACCILCGLILAERALVLASGVLLLVNLVQLIRIVRRAHMGTMTREERALIEQVLQVEEPTQQRRLLDVIVWRDADVGEVLMRQGQIAPPLVYIASGSVDVEVNGMSVGSCGAGDFLGEMSLVSGEAASATVKVALPARIAVFDREGLRRLITGLPEMARALDHTLNKGLAGKIRRMNHASATRTDIPG
jgi:CRP-like cAMP-binding protein